MKGSTAALKTKLRQGGGIKTKTLLIAEWDMNRFANTIPTASNPGTVDEYMPDMFPAASMCYTERPLSGVSMATTESPSTTSDDSGYPQSARFLTANPDMLFKYWVSSSLSIASTPYTISGVTPQVVYAENVKTNKIAIVFDVTKSTPTAFTVSVSTNGTTWNVVSTNPSIGSDGLVQLYLQAGGTWGSTAARVAPTNIRGVRVTVTQMSSGLARAGVIQISPRLELDISDRVKNYSTENAVADASMVAPLGRPSSNSASISLDNADRYFSDSKSTTLAGLIRKNVDFRLDLAIDTSLTSTPTWEYIRMLTMRSDGWSGQDTDGVTVSLRDDSAYLQSIKPLPFLYTDVNASAAIWRMLDSVGYTNWARSTSGDASNIIIPYLWSDGTETVWEIIAKVCESTQSAAYFDEYGVLRVKTREEAFDPNSTPVWTLLGQKSGADLPDIASFETEITDPVNVVNVSYSNTSVSTPSASGIVPMEAVWDEQETQALRSANLSKPIDINSTVIAIQPVDAGVFHYEGVVQIEGEVIRYDAKGYSYYETNGTLTATFVKNAEEKAALDAKNPALAFKNYFNGNLRISKRGEWGTVVKDHLTTISPAWNWAYYRTGTGTNYSWRGGIVYDPFWSTLRLTTTSTFKTNTWYTVARTAATRPLYYGARFKFNGSGYGSGGIAFSIGASDGGYYVELNKTASVSATDRKYWNELTVYTRKSDGSVVRLSKGPQMSIAQDAWYDLDVNVTWSGNNPTMNIYVNGKNVLNVAVATVNSLGTPTNKHGIFTRGYSSVSFEHFYSSAAGLPYSPDVASVWDKIRGGYQSMQLAGWIYNWGSPYSYTTPPGNTRLPDVDLDEFGPIVHEVREYDVKFTEAPVLHSSPFMSNTAQAVITGYNSTPFGAKFIVANMSRELAVINGQESTTFGTTVNQKLFIYGRKIAPGEADKVTVRNDMSVRRHGEYVTDFESKWIQTKDAAQAIADWVASHWDGGDETVRVTVFGNPLVELLDIVDISWTANAMAPVTHKYFVTAISHSFDAGLTTTYTLRRSP